MSQSSWRATTVCTSRRAPGVPQRRLSLPGRSARRPGRQERPQVPCAQRAPPQPGAVGEVLQPPRDGVTDRSHPVPVRPPVEDGGGGPRPPPPPPPRTRGG